MPRNGRRATVPLVVWLSVAAFVGACESQAPSPDVLRVSAIPDQAAANVRAQHLPMLEIACAKAGVRCEWIPIPTYEGVVEALGKGTIDLAYLGGATFV